MVISGLKAISGINFAASVINLVVAAIITATLGEITLEVLEKIVKGELDPEDFDLITKFAENEFLNKVGVYFVKFIDRIGDKEFKDTGKIITDIFMESSDLKAGPKAKNIKN